MEPKAVRTIKDAWLERLDNPESGLGQLLGGTFNQDWMVWADTVQKAVEDHTELFRRRHFAELISELDEFLEGTLELSDNELDDLVARAGCYLTFPPGTCRATLRDIRSILWRAAAGR